MGQMPEGTMFSYGLRSKCADLDGMLLKIYSGKHNEIVIGFFHKTFSPFCKRNRNSRNSQGKPAVIVRFRSGRLPDIQKKESLCNCIVA